MKAISLWTKSFFEDQDYPFYFKRQASSTSDWAKEKASNKDKNSEIIFKDERGSKFHKINLKKPSVFLLEHQTQGRGLASKTWQDSDLMISFLWKSTYFSIAPQACEELAQDLKQALQFTWPELSLTVKAPNDLYLEKGKLAGLLLEVLKQGEQTALILGLGLNVFLSPKQLQSACLALKTQNIHQKTWSIFLQKTLSLWSQRIAQLYEA